jgi:single-strand DNA-binding protein
MNLNQLTIIGFIGRNAETKQLPNGTAVTRFSVATTKSWKDDKGEWNERTQWHNALAYGQGFAQMALRMVKGTHVFVQGELSTRQYERMITVPNGQKSIQHVIQQLAVELKADTIRILIALATPSRAKRLNRSPKTTSPFRGTRSLMTKLWSICHQGFTVDYRDDASSGLAHSFFLARAFLLG